MAFIVGQACYGPDGPGFICSKIRKKRFRESLRSSFRVNAFEGRVGSKVLCLGFGVLAASLGHVQPSFRV